MLSHWLERGGIGQMLAPDPNCQAEDNVMEGKEYDNDGRFSGGMWNIIAPDPNFTSSESRDGSIKVVSVPSIKAPNPNNTYNQVQCIHCHQMTPIERTSNASSSIPTLPSPAPKIVNSTASAFSTPTHTKTKPLSSSALPTTSNSSSSTNLEALVLTAAKDLAESLSSPTAVWEPIKNFFTLCASSTPLTEKQLRKVKRSLKKNPSLLSARSSKMVNLVPDGFTPLHAAAYVGNYEVALILIDFAPDDADVATHDYPARTLNTRDVQGRTALHIASERGHLRLVRLLKQHMSTTSPPTLHEDAGGGGAGTTSHSTMVTFPMGPNAPTDLTGRTPLGWAATSQEASARKHREELHRELFSPGDKSVCGVPTPAKDRTGGASLVKSRTRRFLDISHVASAKKERTDEERQDFRYGFAEMPGMRIEMEDAICHSFPLYPPSSNNRVNDTGNGDGENHVGFFGVFDGHGDGGIASKYVANNIIPCFINTPEWARYLGGGVDALAKALDTACRDVDVDLRAMVENGATQRNGGTTGVMAVISKDVVVVANVGDSRCILVQSCVNDNANVLTNRMNEMTLNDDDDDTGKESNKQSKIKVTPLSFDHKPNLPAEKLRIETAGMAVVAETFQEPSSLPSKEDDKDTPAAAVETTIWKIEKSARDKIAVSRAFGDFDYKSNDSLKVEDQAIISIPDIQVHVRDPERDLFLILACDGVWDVMSNDEVGQFVVDTAQELANECNKEEGGSSRVAANVDAELEIPPKVGDALLNTCLERGSTDNMSVLIVSFSSSFRKGTSRGHDGNDGDRSGPRVLSFNDE